MTCLLLFCHLPFVLSPWLMSSDLPVLVMWVLYLKFIYFSTGNRNNFCWWKWDRSRPYNCHNYQWQKWRTKTGILLKCYSTFWTARFFWYLYFMVIKYSVTHLMIVDDKLHGWACGREWIFWSSIPGNFFPFIRLWLDACRGYIFYSHKVVGWFLRNCSWVWSCWVQRIRFVSPCKFSTVHWTCFADLISLICRLSVWKLVKLLL